MKDGLIKIEVQKKSVDELLHEITIRKRLYRWVVCTSKAFFPLQDMRQIASMEEEGRDERVVVPKILDACDQDSLKEGL